jgi:3-hydroxyacyl-CoA dehydrogenase/3-hydroxy-2-methylbutyryl-CoA dehydrogenase
MQVEGSVALITGGVSGLGHGAAARVVDMGGRVVMMDINEEQGKAAQAALGDSSRFIVCDVSDPDQVTAAVDGAAGAFGSIDILVNAAGVAPAQRVLSRDGAMFDLDLFKFTVGVNLIGMFDVIRNTARVMAGNEPGPSGERGVIVNVASIAAFDGQVGQAAYSASKGGVVGMTLPLARDLASVGIRVNVSARGIMGTPLLAGAPPELREPLAALHVFPQRLGTPADFAHLVTAIVENEMLNGEVIRLDAATRMPPR